MSCVNWVMCRMNYARIWNKYKWLNETIEYKHNNILGSDPNNNFVFVFIS